MARYVKDRRPGRKGTIYPWTPTLAKKAGFEEISNDEAMVALGIGPKKTAEPAEKVSEAQAPEPETNAKQPAGKNKKKE